MHTENNTIYTIGHSNHSIEKFLSLLKQYHIDVVADVRSSPYSKYSPQFNQDILKTALSNNGFRYLYLGDELGARPDDLGCYVENRVSFEKLRKSAAFQHGIDRLFIGMNDCAIALMCSEKEPTSCHRTILVARTLAENGAAVRHILETGEILDQVDIENQLMEFFDIQPDLFQTDRASLVRDAYLKQEDKIIYKLHCPEVQSVNER